MNWEGIQVTLAKQRTLFITGDVYRAITNSCGQLAHIIRYRAVLQCIKDHARSQICDVDRLSIVEMLHRSHIAWLKIPDYDSNIWVIDHVSS